MVCENIQKVMNFYEELQTKAIYLLQEYTGSSTEDLEILLSHESIREINRTSLNNLLKSLETVAPNVVEITLYSKQANLNEEQMFYVEVKQVNGDFDFNFPLHASLSPEHKGNGEVVSFFKYLFIQIAMLRLAAEENLEITSSYVEEILSYFYEKLDEQEPIKEELLMEEKRDLFTFKLKGESEVVAEETLITPPTEKKVDDQEVYFSDVDEDEVDFEFDFEEVYEEETLDGELEPTEEFVEEEVVEENSLVIDFDELNQEFNEIYKTVPASDREQLKGLKADIWEVEMKMEENGIELSDIQSLAYSILGLEVIEENVMKWQISSAKKLLNLIVTR